MYTIADIHLNENKQNLSLYSIVIFCNQPDFLNPVNPHKK